MYNGPGVCEEHCAQAAARVAKLSGLSVKYVGVTDVSPASLEGADVWITPGGEAVEMAKALGPNRIQAIQSYIRKGGKYLGFCAGGFLADHTVDDAKSILGLGLIPGESLDYPLEKGKPQLVPLLWRGATRYVYFEDGPTFNLTDRFKTDVVATYPDGRPATVQFDWGIGRVALSGTHPEATKAWKSSLPYPDPDGDDMDLAQNMLNWLSTGR